MVLYIYKFNVPPSKPRSSLSFSLSLYHRPEVLNHVLNHVPRSNVLYIVQGNVECGRVSERGLETFSPAPFQMVLESGKGWETLHSRFQIINQIFLSNLTDFFIVSFFPLLGFPSLWTSYVRPTQKGWLPLMFVGLMSHAIDGTCCLPCKRP